MSASPKRQSTRLETANQQKSLLDVLFYETETWTFEENKIRA